MEEMYESTVETVTEEGTAYDTVDTASTTETTEENTEVVDTQAEDNSPKGQKNSHYAEIRRKEELRMATARLGDIERQNKEYADRIAAFEEREKRLNELLGNYYEGDDLDGKALVLEAQLKGTTVEALRAEMAEKSARQKAEQDKQNELEYYKGIAMQVQREKAQKMYDEDLATLQKLDANIKSLEELGKDFERLRFTINPLTGEHYSAVEVYNHLKSKIKPLPQTSGAVNTATEEKKETNFMDMSNKDFEEIFRKVVYGG